MSASQRPGAFVYEPLKDLYDEQYPKKLIKRAIRVLELLPGNYDAEIVGIMSNVYLEDKPHYEALSYVWGKKLSATDIQVFILSSKPPNEERNLNFPVTKNLYGALRDLRHPVMRRRLWVDAICINQCDSDGNKAEKSLQVSRMRDIYLYAERVVAHLGEQRDAVETIEFCQSLVQDSTGNVPTFYASTIQQRCACLRLFGFPHPRKVEKDLNGKMSPTRTQDGDGNHDEDRSGRVERSYWTRSWILQELIHDRPVSLYFGRYHIPIESFLRAFSLWYDIVVVADSQVSIGNTSHAISPDEEKQLLHEMWFRAAGNDEIIPAVIATERKKFQEGSPEVPKLPALLKKFRGQGAKVRADKIYAFLGITANEYHIQPDYSKSTYEIFTEITKLHLMKRVLLVLLWVESQDRIIRAGDKERGILPSWVPDFSTEQSLIAKILQSTYDAFQAFYSAPHPADKWRWAFEEDVLVLKGKSVAVVTDVLPPSHVTKHESGHEHDKITLIRYKSNLENIRQENSNSLLVTYENTSWGPCKCEIGDIIVVGGGCRLPIVLRRLEEGRRSGAGQKSENDKYLFVGCCWLISGELQNLTRVNQVKSVNEETKERIYFHDRGFSEIMYGSMMDETDGVECAKEYFIY